MSVCKQAMAARRKAKHDPRYSWKRKDTNTRSARLSAQLKAERDRIQRKSAKK